MPTVMSFYVPAGFTASKVSNAGDVPDPPRHPARYLKSAGHHQICARATFPGHQRGLLHGH
jgi:hypothetical protein